MAQPRAVKKKKAVPTKPTKPTKPAKAPHVVELDEFDPSQVDTVLSMLFARHEPITDDEREAFGLLVSDAQADELGSRTQASDIRALAVRWAPVMDAGVRDHGAAVEGFSSARFVHLLERTQALHLAIRDDEDKRNKVGSVRTAVDLVRAQAKTARDTLYRALRTYAGQRAAEREALAAAYGTADPDQSLLSSLAALGKLGQAWIDRPEKTSRILATTAGLTPGVVAATLDAAKKLRSALGDKTMHGPVRVSDSATVNRIEGRLSSELQEARRIFNEANRRTGLVPKLVPSEAVRHVFERRAGAPAEPDAPAGAESPVVAVAPPKG